MSTMIRCWVLIVCSCPLAVFGQVQVDPKLPDYKKVPGIDGTLKSIGSDTMNNEMALWAEGFKAFYPNVKIEIKGEGSGTAPPALIEGTAQFGPMSRPMKDAEIEAFQKKFGYPPIGLGTSIDMLAVYVHKDNPIQGLTLPQVDAIFSKTPNGGYTRDIRNRGQAGATGDLAKQPISLYGRNSASGTYSYFKEHALFKGDYKDEVKQQPGSAAVVQSVAGDKAAIGYSGIGYKTPGVRAVSLAAAKGEEFVAATPDNAYSGDYPLSRFLLLYVNVKPGTQLDPLRLEFIRYIFSKQGQQEVVKDGYFPVTAEIARQMLQSIGDNPKF